MSGIAAIVHAGAMQQAEALIPAIASVMETRGPDAQQYWADDNAALIHNLLRQGPDDIGKAQPLTLDGRCWITSEARIDDRASLIERIRQAGGHVETDLDDSLLILQAYHYWGVDCLNYLMGDFAFAIWDSGEHRLFCATDQFGTVPVYYSALDQASEAGIIVSNTLNAIRVHPYTSNSLDELAIADYLQWRTNENSHGTIFKQIKRLPAAHYLVFEQGRINLCRYWQLEPRQAFYKAESNTYIAEFGEYLNQAVKDRVRSNHLGVHLSGGMDSTSVAAVANGISDKRSNDTDTGRLVAYTYKPGFDDMDLELPYAQEVTQKLGIQHQVISGEPGAYESAALPPELRPPEPSFTDRESDRFRLLNHIGSYGNLLLTGFGGDPLLKSAGIQIKDMLSPNSALLLLKQAYLHWRFYESRPHLGLNYSPRKPSPQSCSWLRSQFVSSLALDERYLATQENRLDPTRHLHGMYQDSLWRRVSCWHDPGFSHIPVRVRHPFFDLRLLKYVRDLPPFPLLYHKHILRQSMVGILPDSILKRPKTPMAGNLFALQLKENGINKRLLDLLNNEAIQEYVDTDALINRLGNLQKPENIDLKRLMRTATLSDWLNGYLAVPNYWRQKKTESVLTKVTNAP